MERTAVIKISLMYLKVVTFLCFARILPCLSTFFIPPVSENFLILYEHLIQGGKDIMKDQQKMKAAE